MLALSDATVGLLIAVSALAGALATSAIQFFIERWRRAQDRKDRQAERDEDRSDQARQRRRDLYRRQLRALRQIPNDLNEYVVDNEGRRKFLLDFGRGMSVFDADLLLEGASDVRQIVDDLPGALNAFNQRHNELNDQDSKRPRDKQMGASGVTIAAFRQIVLPLIERLAEAMRNDLATG